MSKLLKKFPFGNWLPVNVVGPQYWACAMLENKQTLIKSAYAPHPRFIIISPQVRQSPQPEPADGILAAPRRELSFWP